MNGGGSDDSTNDGSADDEPTDDRSTEAGSIDDESPDTAATTTPPGIQARQIRPSEFDRVHGLHNRFTGQDVPRSEMRGWYEATPALFHAAFDGEDLVGVVTGRLRGTDVAELAGLGVMPDRRREGIGRALVAAFESGARHVGADRVSVASAGGSVDRFYAAQGYDPWAVLVRTPVGEDGAAADYDIVEERVEDGVRKRYVDAVDADFEFAREVGEAFGDDEAVFVMRTKVSG